MRTPDNSFITVIQKINIAIEKSNKYEVINVISNFQPVGYEIKGVTKNYAFQLGGLGAALMILYLCRYIKQSSEL